MCAVVELTEDEKIFIAENIDSDVNRLALKIKKSNNIRPQYVLQQIAGRQMIKHKVPQWATVSNLLYPIHLSIEQCSSETTAEYKARIICDRCEHYGVARNRFIDLTGGFGVDFYFIGKNFDEKTYVERNSELVSIVRHNLSCLGMDKVNVINGECEDYIRNVNENYSVLFIDPARRDKNGSKTVSIEDCTPNILGISDILLDRAEIVIVKLSPMLDITEAIQKLKSIVEVHVVATDNECKELLLVLRKDGCSDPRIYTYNQSSKCSYRFDFSIEEERNCQLNIASSIGKYLYEPNAAIMKSGAYKSVASRFGLKKLHVNSHLYTSDERIAGFAGRSFEILSMGALGKNNVPATLSGIDKSNITVRNFPQKVDDIRKKLKMKDGGCDYIFATTALGERKILIHCRPI
ncbi:MAG: SAM-dependent methyltransferase [Bacteroidales bacterium]|nr:SAM-dependent methyltransferase [Bacteroidales bacterium]